MRLASICLAALSAHAVMVTPISCSASSAHPSSGVSSKMVSSLSCSVLENCASFSRNSFLELPRCPAARPQAWHSRGGACDRHDLALPSSPMRRVERYFVGASAAGPYSMTSCSVTLSRSARSFGEASKLLGKCSFSCSCRSQLKNSLPLGLGGPNLHHLPVVHDVAKDVRADPPCRVRGQLHPAIGIA